MPSEVGLGDGLDTWFVTYSGVSHLLCNLCNPRTGLPVNHWHGTEPRHSIWSNYSDLTRPKGSFFGFGMFRTPYFRKKSRLVKYYHNLARDSLRVRCVLKRVRISTGGCWTWSGLRSWMAHWCKSVVLRMKSWICRSKMEAWCFLLIHEKEIPPNHFPSSHPGWLIGIQPTNPIITI